jgi:hypothetical protein
VSTPSSGPDDRLISLGDALEEFYKNQMARAALEGQRLGLDLPEEEE